MRKVTGQLHIWQEAIHLFVSPNTYMAAAGNAFYALFSIFPLMLLLVAIASNWVDPLVAENEIITQLEFVAPGLGQLLGQNLELVVNKRGPITGFALVTLLWSASTMFNVLSRTVDQIFYYDELRPSWHHRGLALLMVLGISTLLMAVSLGGSTFVAVIGRYLPDVLLTVYRYVSQFLALFFGVIFFGIMYRFLPHISPPWKYILPGAITSGLLWEIAKRGFLLYLTTYLSRSNLIYGSVTTIVGFLMWVYVSGLIFFLGAHIAASYTRYNGLD